MTTKGDFTKIITGVLLNAGDDLIQTLRNINEDAEITEFERMLTFALLMSLQGPDDGVGFNKSTIQQAAALLREAEKKYKDVSVDSIIRTMKK